jgi:hypothetical protein
MRKTAPWCLGLWFALVSAAAAAPPAGKTIQDTWDAAYLNGGKAGFVHTKVTRYDVKGHKVLRTTVELNLTILRNRQAVELRMLTGDDETERGKITQVFMQQFLAKQQNIVTTGEVDGSEVHIKVRDRNGKVQVDKWNPWNDEVVGLYGQQKLFKDHKARPGDEFTYQSFEFELTSVFTTHVKVKDYENVRLLTTGKKAKLLRVEEEAEKIAGFQPPPLTVWLDKDLRAVRTQFELPGIGKLVVERSTEEVARKRGTNLPDIMESQLIRLNRRLPDGYDTRDAVYRITIAGDKDAGSSFARDRRQKVKNAKGNTFELHIQTFEEPSANSSANKVKEEYLKSNYFINSKDERVRADAEQAVGDETNAWKKALRIESWVHRNMNQVKHEDYTEALATADHVARTLEGDCTEYSMLTAAMCRAADVPARTAVGLVYVDLPRGPVLAFHMWTEVYVEGQWVPIDATRGRGFVGATHLKIADQSWHDVHDLKPLVPILRVVGKAKVEIISPE